MTTDCREMNGAQTRVARASLHLGFFFATCLVWNAGCTIAPETQSHGLGTQQAQYQTSHFAYPQLDHPVITDHQVELPRQSVVAVRVPENYTCALRPDLASVELARWWEAFQSEPLQQILVWAEANPNRFSSQCTLPHVCNDYLQAGPNALQVQHYLQIYARKQHLAETTKTYFDLALLNERLRLADEDLVFLEQLLQLAKQRYEEGDIGRADVLLAEAAVGKQRALGSELSTEWMSISSRLRSMVGFEVPTDYLNSAAMQGFPQPLLIDLGQPRDLLSRRSDLLALKIAIDGLQNNTLANEALLRCHQDSIDRSYAAVEAASHQLKPLSNERIQLEETVDKLQQSLQLTLEQYALGRATVLDVLKVQNLWQEVAGRLAVNQHRLFISHVELYVAAGGGDANVAAKPNRLTNRSMALDSDRNPTDFTHEAMAECSLAAPADEVSNVGDIVLLPPRERIDELGNGTVTVVSLGSPLTISLGSPPTDDSVRPNDGATPKSFPQNP